MDVTGAPDLKDAMVAILGGGIALGGLLLIFVGFLFGQAAILANSQPPAPQKMTERFRSAALWGILPFAASLLVALAATFYWFFPCSNLAKGVLIAFILCTLGSIVYGIKTAQSL
jgi:uncharacterized BrkB/YihY/UPF0761 family membrane protein